MTYDVILGYDALIYTHCALFYVNDCAHFFMEIAHFFLTLLTFFKANSHHLLLLTIHDIEYGDRGAYACEFRNTLGVINSTGILLVHGKLENGLKYFNCQQPNPNSGKA